MATTVGLLGRPGSGKSTLFELVTGRAPERMYLTTGVKPEVGIVLVPDSRLEKLAGIFKPRKTTPIHFGLMDLPGFADGDDRKLVTAALTNYRTCQALAISVDLFREEAFDPAARDTKEFIEELYMIDLLQIEGLLPTLKKRAAGKESEAEAKLGAILSVKDALDNGRPARSVLSDEEERLVGEYAFLSSRPMIVVCNLGDETDEEKARGVKDVARQFGLESMTIRAKLEKELLEISAETERREFMELYGITESGANRFISACFELLRLKTFFTCSEAEVRAWTIRAGGTALDAAAEIHSDMAKGFIRAEVYSVDDLCAYGGFEKIRGTDRMRLVGKSHVVEEGEIVQIRFKA